MNSRKVFLAIILCGKLCRTQAPVPDTTALVTLRDKPLGGNDSMPMVQVRCRKTVCDPSIESMLTSEKYCRQRSGCISVKINQQDFPLKPGWIYSECIILTKNDLSSNFNKIYNFSHIKLVFISDDCPNKRFYNDPSTICRRGTNTVVKKHHGFQSGLLYCFNFSKINFILI